MTDATGTRVRPCDPCTCRQKCGDTTDELGTCKGLPRRAEPPLVEIILVPRVTR